MEDVGKFVVDVCRPFGCVSFVNNGETGEEALARVEHERNERIAYFREKKKEYPNMEAHWNNEINALKQASYVVTDIEGFQNLQASFYLSKPAVEITKDRYYEMLDVLPPMNYVTRNGVTEFCLCEFTSGSFTSQFAYDKKTGKYWEKTVDALDPKTWLDACIPE